MGSPPLTAVGQPRPLQAGEFIAAVKSDQVSFALDRVGPPSQVYIQQDDVLSVVASFRLGNDTAIITGRFLRVPDGVVVPFSYVIKSTGPFSNILNLFPLGEGYLLSVTAVSSAALQRGGCYVSIGLQRGLLTTSPRAGTTQILFQDYVTGNQPVSWPGGRIISASEGPGFLVARSPSNPAAGSDWVATTVGGSRVKIRAAIATLTTSAAVANRQVTFFMQLPTSVNQQVGATANVTASSVAKFVLAEGIGPYTGADGTFYLPLPRDTYFLPSVGAFGSQTNNIQAADQWASIQVSTEEWIDVG